LVATGRLRRQATAQWTIDATPISGERLGWRCIGQGEPTARAQRTAAAAIRAVAAVRLPGPGAGHANKPTP
jgi:hypothetical protein